MISRYNLTHFLPNSVAGCISKVQCSAGGNLEFRIEADYTVILWRTINLGRQTSDILKKSMQATIYRHYD
jgi:hypothetical protein